MSDGTDDIDLDRDPFREHDPRAAEREARRREREARRREKRQKTQRSLADRVKGSDGSGRGAAPAEPPAPPPARPSPDPAPRRRAPDAEPGGRPASPEPGAPPTSPEPEPPAPETGEWAADAGSGDDGFQWSDATDAPARREADEPAHGDSGWITPITDRATAWVGGGAGAAGVDRRTLMIRRGAAAGALVAGLLLIFLLAKAIGGGDEPAPVAAPAQVKTIDVVVPEGLTIEQIAKVAKKAKLKGSYEKAAKKALKSFPLKRYDAKGADTLEGFLFPATYELEKGARAKDLVDKQLDAFEQNFGSVDLRAAEKKNLTPYDVLIIASMVEEEVMVADERPKVAAVIYNRLAAGDTLGIDATLRYELGKYDGQLLQSELDAPTPYNTRVTPGLPPTPIANPGLASIEAAANPAKTDAYYFVIKPGTCGEHFFTADEAKFQAAQARYQEALAAEGGSPTDCS